MTQDSLPSSPPFSLKLFLGRSLLLGFSFFIGLLCIEIGLRLFYPKFQYAAESHYETSNTRIWSRNANSSYQRHHPDTQALHWVCHNNLGLRQHRDFSEDTLKASTTLAFFGDSFTENLRIPAAYSFTEPLDFLLNQNSEGKQYSTLNFGVDGYGTDQAYLYYKEAASKIRLDHVFYVFSLNDIRNNVENRLFHLDAESALVQSKPQKSAWWTRFISKFHLTYLVVETIEAVVFKSSDRNKRVDLQTFIDHAQNYHNSEADKIEEAIRKDPAYPELQKALALFTTILHEWKDTVEANGGQFHLIVLPRKLENKALGLFEHSSISKLNLFEKFSHPIEDKNDRSLRFENDGHWSEKGNAWATQYIYDYMTLFEKELHTKSVDSKQALASYYNALNSKNEGSQWFDITLKVEPAPASAIDRYRTLEPSLE